MFFLAKTSQLDKENFRKKPDISLSKNGTCGKTTLISKNLCSFRWYYSSKKMQNPPQMQYSKSFSRTGGVILFYNRKDPFLKRVWGSGFKDKLWDSNS